MKLLSFQRGHKTSYGIVSDGSVIDAGAILQPRYPDLASALIPEGIDALRELASGKSDFSLDSLVFLPPIPKPEKLVCVGLNYASHANEINKHPGEYPNLFLRLANAQVGHQQALVRPKVSEKLDYEGELAVVIGKPGRHIARSEVWSHIAGFSCFNDGSVRDWQLHAAQYGPGKNFEKSGSMGPWIVTSDEIQDYKDLSVTTRVNGSVRQEGLLSDLIFDVPALIEYISMFTTLQPGDVIATGTPGGTGGSRSPQVFLKKGDLLEIEIPGVGVLSNPVENEL